MKNMAPENGRTLPNRNSPQDAMTEARSPSPSRMVMSPMAPAPPMMAPQYHMTAAPQGTVPSPLQVVRVPQAAIEIFQKKTTGGWMRVGSFVVHDFFPPSLFLNKNDVLDFGEIESGKVCLVKTDKLPQPLISKTGRPVFFKRLV